MIPILCVKAHTCISTRKALEFGHIRKAVFFLSFFFFFCLFSRATPTAYGGSQARGLIGAVATSLHHSHSNAGSERAVSVTYTTAHGSVEPLTHWARPGIEPATSWFLVGFVNHGATTGTPRRLFSLRWNISMSCGNSCFQLLLFCSLIIINLLLNMFTMNYKLL